MLRGGDKDKEQGIEGREMRKETRSIKMRLR